MRRSVAGQAARGSEIWMQCQIPDAKPQVVSNEVGQAGVIAVDQPPHPLNEEEGVIIPIQQPLVFPCAKQ